MRANYQRLPKTAHTLLPWRIHSIAPDFDLEDVWELPTPGGPDDFTRLVQQTASGDPSQTFSGIARVLWELRWKIGGLLGWDKANSGIDSRVPTLRERLPQDLYDSLPGPTFDNLPFRPVYWAHNEWAAEIANRTMHGIMHLSWVPDGAGHYRGQMAVLVKPNGLFGKLYMAIIRPFRYLFVYPSLLRAMERRWQAEGQYSTL